MPPTPDSGLAEWAGWVVAIVTGLVSLGWQVIRDRRKPAVDQAQTADLITQAAGQLVGDLRDQVESLKDEIGQLRRRVEELERDATHRERRHRHALEFIRTLQAFIAEHLPGVVPPAEPADLTDIAA